LCAKIAKSNSLSQLENKNSIVLKASSINLFAAIPAAKQENTQETLNNLAKKITQPFGCVFLCLNTHIFQFVAKQT
jgi:heme/copper-type cytochrome/quinol oxidase subunit 3